MPRQIFALIALAGGLFLGLALLTHNPADPPSSLIWPPSAEIANGCGEIGAQVSHFALKYFGYGAYFAVMSLFALAWRLNRQTPLTEPSVRSVGWLMALVGLTTVAAIAGPYLVSSGEFGPGGFLGASFRALMSSHLTRSGAFILALSMLLGGLLLCTDYVLLTLTVWMIGAPSKHVLTGAASIARGVRSMGGARLGPAYVAPLHDHAAGTLAPQDEFADEEEEAAEDYLEEEEVDCEDEGAEDMVQPRLKKPAPTERVDRPIAGAGSGASSILAKAAQLGGAALAAAKLAANTAVRQTSAQVASHSAASGPVADGSDDASHVRIRNLGGGESITRPFDGSDAFDDGDYQLPPIDLLMRGENQYDAEHEKQVRMNARLLEKTFLSFGFKVKVVEIETGPVISQYEVELEAGLRLSKITSLSDDLAIALRVPSVRIVAPIPGKNTVGIEVPNKVRQLVRIREVIEEAPPKTEQMRLPLFLGKDVSGNPLIVDMASLPHLLIAGRTGTGKSVCLNSLIVSMLMTRRPDEVRMLMIDPKMVELSPYKTLPHLMHPVVTDMKKAEAILGWAVEKMEERYALLARAGVRHMSVFNQLGEEELRDRLQPETEEEWESIPKHLPYIVIIADEIADLMMTAPKEVETHIIRLAQKSRAVGIHLVLATQKPTVDVITGLIKSNLPARIAFQVASRTDSRVVLDEMGADKLLGNGDMLFLYPGTSTMLRGQGTYVSDEEINGIIDCIGTDTPQFVHELVELKVEQPEGEGGSGLPNRDDLYASAVDVVVREGRGSVSLLQRSLGIGYGRAARLIDYMAEDGIVGAYNGSQAREVTLTPEQWQAMQRGEANTSSSKTAAKNLEKAPPKGPHAGALTGPHQAPGGNKSSRSVESALVPISGALAAVKPGKIDLRDARRGVDEVEDSLQEDVAQDADRGMPQINPRVGMLQNADEALDEEEWTEDEGELEEETTEYDDEEDAEEEYEYEEEEYEEEEEEEE